MLDAQLECIQAGDRRRWRMFHRNERFDYCWHYHPEFELTLIVTGTGRRFIGDSIADYTIGDLVLMGPNLPHTYVSDGPRAGSLCCQFGDDLLGRAWTELPEFESVARLLQRARRGLHFTESALSPWWSMLDLEPARQTHALLGQLIDLAARDDGTELTGADYQPQIDSRTMTRIDLLMRHIAENISEPLKLDDLAEVACLSPAATSRFFRRQTGRTITDYINHARVAAACRMLASRDEPVSRVAWECGFGNLSNFHRQFRRITGVTPVVYRAHPTRAAIEDQDSRAGTSSPTEADTEVHA